MFKYVKFKKVNTGDTVLEFKEVGILGENVKINYFDVPIVSLESDSEDDINNLINAQDSQIECEEVSKDEFIELVKNSAQINRIKDIVKAKIAEKYSFADEIKLIKLSTDDPKRQEYEDYVNSCKDIGKELKEQIGYIK